MALAVACVMAAVSVVAVIVVVTWARFASDVRAHRERVRRGSRVVPSAFGPIEVATVGKGSPVLVSHGFGGGFDHVETRRFLDAGFQAIAPSRFGYLRSAMPPDPSPEKQADAFAALLDELEVERVAVVGVSVGAFAAVQFAARHPQRCRALVVIVPPLAGKPRHRAIRSDFGYWLALELAPSTMIRCMLGTDPFVVDASPPAERRRALDLVVNVLPIGERLRGILDDRHTMSTPQSIPFDRVDAPTLVMSTKDDPRGSFQAARLVASAVRGARLVSYRTGGHAWIGQDHALFAEVLSFLASSEPPELRADRAPDERLRK